LRRPSAAKNTSVRRSFFEGQFRARGQKNIAKRQCVLIQGSLVLISHFHFTAFPSACEKLYATGPAGKASWSRPSGANPKRRRWRRDRRKTGAPTFHSNTRVVGFVLTPRGGYELYPVSYVNPGRRFAFAARTIGLAHVHDVGEAKRTPTSAFPSRRARCEANAPILHTGPGAEGERDQAEASMPGTEKPGSWGISPLEGGRLMGPGLGTTFIHPPHSDLDTPSVASFGEGPGDYCSERTGRSREREMGESRKLPTGSCSKAE